MDSASRKSQFATLSRFVHDECEKRLNAYRAQPRDAAEHYETENEVLSGGYAYRQLYELVQNAADAILESKEGTGRIHINLKPGMLEVANSGAALDEDGIVALLNARSSAKRGDQIGRFGIGFKSLLKLGGKVDLVSRSTGLRFEPETCRDKIRQLLNLPGDARAPGMRLADVLDPTDPAGPLAHGSRWSWATTVVRAEIADPKTFERLKKELAEFLLFVQSDISLDVEAEGAVTRSITKRVEEGVSVVSDGLSEARWRLFETRSTIANAEAANDATHIQARSEIPLAWAVPIGGREQAGRFWAFFPTETHTLTAGIVNAPWKLNSDRTNLIRGPWNEAVMKAAAELIADSLPSLASAEDYGAAVSAFPRQPDRQDEIAVPLVNAIWDRLVEAEILPDIDGSLHVPSEITRHFIEEPEICETWASLCRGGERRRYLHPHYYNSKARISRLNALKEEADDRDVETISAPAPHPSG